MFADDTNLVNTPQNINSLYDVINNGRSNISDWFQFNKLSLNVKKTNHIISK